MGTASFPGRDWTVAAPDADVDAVALATAVADLVRRPDRLGVTEALCVVHRGRIVAEWCPPGSSVRSTHISWSMAKSITHALVGIATGDGLLSADRSDLLPEWRSDARSTITLGHLLTMTSGLEWVEDYVDDSVSHVIEMLAGGDDGLADHAAYAARKRLVAEPGTTWSYSSGTTNIIARILADALGEERGSHERVESFMRTRLFDPIGMTASPKFDAAGTFVGSSFVYATARDFARFGWLYLNEGTWNGDAVLPPGWTGSAFHRVATDPENGFGYGSHWWLPDDDDRSILALGYDGQFTWVSPDRELVVVHLGRTPAEHREALVAALRNVIGAFPVVRAPIGHDGGHD